MEGIGDGRPVTEGALLGIDLGRVDGTDVGLPDMLGGALPINEGLFEGWLLGELDSKGVIEDCPLGWTEGCEVGQSETEGLLEGWLVGAVLTEGLSEGANDGWLVMEGTSLGPDLV